MIKSIHNAGMSLLQELVTDVNDREKVAIFSYPTDCSNKRLQGKMFYVPVIVNSPTEAQVGKSVLNITLEGLIITLMNDKIEDLYDKDDTIKFPKNNYKRYNVNISYQGKRYIVKEEVRGDFENNFQLYCDSKSR